MIFGKNWSTCRICFLITHLISRNLCEKLIENAVTYHNKYLLYFSPIFGSYWHYFSIRDRKQTVFSKFFHQFGSLILKGTNLIFVKIAKKNANYYL